MSNRAQRRREAREAQKLQRQQSKADVARITAKTNPLLTEGSIGFQRGVDLRQAITNRIARNGITEKDVEDSYSLGFTEGREAAQKADALMFFAAICLALKKLHGFGAARCHRVLTEVYNFVSYGIDSEESIQKVFDDIGLEINLTGLNPLDDPVQEVK